MKQKYKLIALLIVTTLWISGCDSIPSHAVLKLPPELIVPSISAQEVSCLPDNVFNKLKKRDKLKSARIETLISIIKSTHN